MVFALAILAASVLGGAVIAFARRRREDWRVDLSPQAGQNARVMHLAAHLRTHDEHLCPFCSKGSR